MTDMMMTIYNELIKHETIKSLVTKNRIKFYEAPETMDTSKPFIIIEPLGVPVGVTYGSDKELSQRLTYQINVEAPKRQQVKEIQLAAKQVMRNLRFFQMPGGLDEYFSGTKRYVDARRYRTTTKLYDNNY
ncbi:hypothetical protein [Atopobacter phocae]|uniref:hypothetical protein n=1 Tax=Atopobacter phocae TaxID=136492 RepID=UPI00046FA58F|nr:hypothetical protein [Atopobacter phocae]